MKDRTVARELAARSIAQGDSTGWFEELYRRALDEPDVVPWADMRPNPHLLSWAKRKRLAGGGRRALVVGCGYGDDAEWLAARGFSVVAFDVSPTAISIARSRFPRSQVEYVVADVLAVPAAWLRAFDLVFEAYTLQVLTGKHRERAAQMIASTVKRSLLVIARGRDDGEDSGDMPWPLTRADLRQLEDVESGLTMVSFEDYTDDEIPPVRRFRVEYRRGSPRAAHSSFRTIPEPIPVQE